MASSLQEQPASAQSVQDLVISQISLGGFPEPISAKAIADYLEESIGLVWRCRLKTTWTPPDSFPDFSVPAASVLPPPPSYSSPSVLPHAFIHFVSPSSAISAASAASRGTLLLHGNPLRVSLGPQNPFRTNQLRRTVTPFRLPDTRLQIGRLSGPSCFTPLWCGPHTGLDFFVDPFDGTCRFVFPRETAFSLRGTRHHTILTCSFKLEFSVGDLDRVVQYPDSTALVLLLKLAASPWVSYRTADTDVEQPVPVDPFEDDDPWVRTTDFTPTRAVGRSDYYLLFIPPRHGPRLKKALDYFKEWRLLSTEPRPTGPLRVVQEEPMGPMDAPFFSVRMADEVPFSVLYLLNAAVHRGVFDESQVSSSGFLDALRSCSDKVNIAALKRLCVETGRVFDATGRLQAVQKWAAENPRGFGTAGHRSDIIEVRKMVVTPTRAYFLPPQVELSNRVLREYGGISDRFLRVTFTDEGMQTLNSNVLNCHAASIVKEITSNSFPQKTAVFGRVRSMLTEGVWVCGRKYSFLAFSANQLRDRSAWFFAEGDGVGTTEVKTWMGRFINQNVAKCAARMGQCFSSTYATVDLSGPLVDQEFPDVERNGYVFSDGIGTITPGLAARVARELGIPGHPPCAYQIRYAGFKGVVATWPKQEGDGEVEMRLRPSMNKFQSEHTVLEICSWTAYHPVFLNRQIITLLSAIGVADSVFWEMQTEMISRLDRILKDASVALDIVSSSCTEEQGETALVMLRAGFTPETEPHLKGVLSCIRAGQLWGLREKAWIFVQSGRWLMGCLDELGVLEHGQCFIQVSNPPIGSSPGRGAAAFEEGELVTGSDGLQVVTGFVVVAKNPCLHPGDVRILEAVDVPGLRHMWDCLVFPQKGDRPHTNEASGSDLDGDLYFATWDPNLLPPSCTSFPPMDYTVAEAKNMRRPINQKDIIEFFTKNMVNEHLGTICNAHVVHADISERGALDESCLRLAELAATAVDFPKTGKVVSMPYQLKPKLYPDFMGKEKFQTYRSEKILGKLYRHIRDAYGDQLADPGSFPGPGPAPYDTDLDISGSDKYLTDAWERKCCYDIQLRGLLGQYKVTREEEVITGFVWSMPKGTGKKLGDMKEKLTHCYRGLRKETRAGFEKMWPGFENMGEEEKRERFEQKASAWYRVTYHPDWVKKAHQCRGPDGEEGDVFLSFAWIADDHLARIKARRQQG